MEFAKYDLNSIYSRKKDIQYKKNKSEFSKRTLGGKVGYTFSTIIIWIGAFVMLFPFLWMVLSSLKTNAELTSNKFIFFPSEPQWNIYKELFSDRSFYIGLRNTMIIELLVIPIGTFTSSLAAFAFAKMKFRFKKVILITLMTAMMIPSCSLLFTQFEMWESLGAVGTNDFRVLLPFIIPGMFSRCSMIFFLTTFMKNAVHDSMIESAKIDGASFFRMYWQIVLPLCKSALAAQAIFWFVAIWNDYFGPSIYLNSDVESNYLTLQVALMNMYSDVGSVGKKNLIFAASTISSIPMIVFFLCFRNMFVQSTALSGVKE